MTSARSERDVQRILQRRPASSPIEWALLSCCVLVGFAARMPGLTSTSLWFDDAWAALASRVPAGTATHMVVTTPLYTMAMRSWIRLDPHSTTWAQLPALVFGLLGIVAVYLLLGVYDLWRPLPLVGALVVAVSPICITYSVRVKEYAFDLVACCVLLWLLERLRTKPTSTTITALVVTSILSITTSATTMLVAAVVVAMLVLHALEQPALRRRAALAALVIIGSAGIVTLVIYRHISPALQHNWWHHGFMANVSSLHELAFSFQEMGSGIAHGLFTIPTTYSFTPNRLAPLTLMVAVASLLGLMVVVTGVVQASHRSSGLHRALPAALLLVVVVVAAGIGRVPLGDGRTDEVLYPAVLVLTGIAVSAVVQRSPGLQRATGRTGTVVAAVLALGGLGVVTASEHRAAYPAFDLTALHHALEQERTAGVPVVVDGYLSFTWAFEDLSPWTVSFVQHQVPWPMGFHVVSRSPQILLSSNYLQPDVAIRSLSHRAPSIWYIGIDYGVFNITTPRGLWDFEYNSPTIDNLLNQGYRPTVERIQGHNVFAVLLSLSASPASASHPEGKRT